jgi:hypothetical protein
VEEHSAPAEREQRNPCGSLVVSIALLGAPVVIWILRPVLSEIIAAVDARVSVHVAQVSPPRGMRSPLTGRRVRSQTRSACVRRGDARRVPVGSGRMWNPPDPDETAGELYRLMPSRPRSEIREALDAATGRDRTVSGSSHEARPEPGGLAPARRTAAWLGPFLSSTAANVAGGIIVVIVIAVMTYLFAHHGSRTVVRQPPPSPSATAAAAHT